MAVGALFVVSTPCMPAVAARAREIATLRAIGYGAFAVAVSVILEAAALAVTGRPDWSAFAWTLLTARRVLSAQCFQADGFAGLDRHGDFCGRGRWPLLGGTIPPFAPPRVPW